MELQRVRFASFAELTEYCYRVASAVGLISIEIFGYKNVRCRDYAYYLGLALQLTNIIRDVGTDLANGGRIYLPLDEIARFNYSEEELVQQKYDERFVALMKFQAERAHAYFQRATETLPAEDHLSIISWQLLRKVDFSVLALM